MTTDQAYKLADYYIGIAIEVWSGEIVEKYPEAKLCYDEAVRLRDEYFSDNKKVLTEDLCPF